MSFLEQIILAIALAMDCFAVSIVSGTLLNKLKWDTFFTMALSFGLFQGAMPLIGWIVSRWTVEFTQSWDHWLAFTLLTFIGAKMIYEHLTSNDSPSLSPTRLIVIIALSIATSIDAFAVGITFSCLGMTDLTNILPPVAIITATSFTLSLCGSILGATLGKRLNLHAELLGGTLLIIIGFKILIEHLLTN